MIKARLKCRIWGIPGLVVILIFWSLRFLFAGPAVDYEFDPVIVTANRFPVSFSNITRTVSVIDSQQIAAASAHSIADLLSGIGNIDLMRRGPHDVQAEAGIRGGSFEETLILVDGVRMNDPQTAHHNFDFPVTLQDVEQIEILHGPGSGLYGADALAGVINIITKNKIKNSCEIYCGDYTLAGGYISLGGKTGIMQNQVSVHAARSDGYMENTDFKNANILYRSAINTKPARISLQAGYISKKFGANSFYSAAFPNEWESTKTALTVLKAEHTGTFLSMIPQISWRNHKDDFMLDRGRPDWNRNRHTGNSYSVEIPIFIQLGSQILSFGGTWHNEILHSSNLGDHNRTRGGVYCALQQNVGRYVILNSTVQDFYFPQYGWKLWPAQDIAWRINGKIKLFVSAGKSFRMPSFTELYYNTPANVGNPLLKHSQAVSYEGGLDWQETNFYAHIALFTRNGKNMIDWARQNSTEPWQAMNVANMDTRGFELMGRYSGRSRYPFNIYIGWMLLDTGKATPGYESRYLFNSIKYQVNTGFTQKLPCATELTWQFKCIKRQADDPYTLVDMALFKTIQEYNFYIKITNIFNQPYREISGVRMAGRWFSTGFSYTF